MLKWPLPAALTRAGLRAALVKLMLEKVLWNVRRCSITLLLQWHFTHLRFYVDTSLCQCSLQLSSKYCVNLLSALE